MRYLTSITLAFLLFISATVSKHIAYANPDEVKNLRLPIYNIPGDGPFANGGLSVRADHGHNKTAPNITRPYNAGSGLRVPGVFVLPTVVFKAIGSLPGAMASIVSSSSDVAVVDSGLAITSNVALTKSSHCCAMGVCRKCYTLPFKRAVASNGTVTYHNGTTTTVPHKSHTAASKSSSNALRVPRVFIFLSMISPFKRAVATNATATHAPTNTTAPHNSSTPAHKSSSNTLEVSRVFIALSMISRSVAQHHFTHQLCTDCRDPVCRERKEVDCHPRFYPGYNASAHNNSAITGRVPPFIDAPVGGPVIWIGTAGIAVILSLFLF